MDTLGLIGLVPFLVLFAGLVATRLPSYIIGFSTLGLTSALAFFLWKTPIASIGFGIAEGFLLAIIPILWVIFAAVLTYYLGVESGAIDIIKKSLGKITPDRNVQAVVIAFCLGGFLESVAGFGTAVAIPAAMLIALGFNPVRSSIISLVANSVPVAFGALGIPVIILAKITSLDLALLSKYVVIQLAPFAILVPVALLVIANGSFKGIRKSLPDALFIGIVFTITQTLVGLFVGPELVAVAGSLVSMILFIVVKRMTTKNRVESTEHPKELFIAVINYLVLLVLVLSTRLIHIAPLTDVPFTVNVPVGTHHVTIDWLTTPGTLLVISALIGALIQGLSLKSIVSIAGSSARKIAPSALTILSIVALAKVMGYSGIIQSVALTLSTVSGAAYPLIAPLIGALGTFVTGSDTSSNILLGELQKNAAINTGYDSAWITASNTSGATAGKMISPQSIAVAAATVGLKNEREIIRTTVYYCVGYALILGVYVFMVAKFVL